MKRLFLVVLASILTAGFVYAAPPDFLEPPANVIIDGLSIIGEAFNYYPADSQLGYAFHVYNQSNGYIMTNATTHCHLHMINSTGHLIYELDGINTTMDGNTFFINASAGFKEGDYGYHIHCNASDPRRGGFLVGNFIATNDGHAPADTLPIIIFVGFAMLLFLILGIFLYLKFEEGKETGE